GPALGVPEPVRAEADHRVELRRADGATLRDDLDHAVRRLGPVERRGGRALDDLDALDVVGVDVVQTADIRAAALRGPAPRLAVHPDPVDVDDRLVPLRQTPDATDPDGRARADLPRPRHHHQPRDPLAEELVDVRRGRGRQDLV